MRKIVSKSVRLDEPTYNYVNKFVGDSFSNKFENIVKFCRDSEDERNKRLQVLDDLIEKRIIQLDDLNNKLFSLQKIEKEFTDLYSFLDEYKNNIIGGK